MKIQRIPAQITTVEDKIAGNLNLTQIILLILPIFIFLIMYNIFIPAWYKIPLFLILGVIPPLLAIRFKQKLILNWLTILLRYNMRPKYYVFNKNDLCGRAVNLFPVEKNQKVKKTTAADKRQAVSPTVSFGDLIKLEDLLTNPNYSFSMKSQKKGVFSIAIEQKPQ